MLGGPLLSSLLPGETEERCLGCVSSLIVMDHFQRPVSEHLLVLTVVSDGRDFSPLQDNSPVHERRFNLGVKRVYKTHGRGTFFLGFEPSESTVSFGLSRLRRALEDRLVLDSARRSKTSKLNYSVDIFPLSEPSFVPSPCIRQGTCSYPGLPP
jgi:hypothetical protein